MAAKPGRAERDTVTRRRLLGGGAVGALSFILAACQSGASSTTTAKPAVPSVPAATPEPRELTLLVASSLTDAFQAIGKAFTDQPGMNGVNLTFSFGASSQLRTQLEQGAPADLYASADTVQMDQAVKAGVIQGTPQIFARNRLVVIVPRDNPGHVQSLADLARPGLKLVTTAKEVPVGAYTRQILANAARSPEFGPQFEQRVLANVVSEEANVRQVLTKVQLGEADAGIVYSSDVQPGVASQVTIIPIPDPLNVIAEDPIAATKATRAPKTAEAFIAFVLSSPSQALLKTYGFVPVK